jgi:hypothetical protein
VFLDHIDPICFLPLVTHLHALIGLHIPYIHIGLGFMVIELLSPAIISYRTSIPSFLMLSMTYIFVRVFDLLSVMM